MQLTVGKFPDVIFFLTLKQDGRFIGGGVFKWRSRQLYDTFNSHPQNHVWLIVRRFVSHAYSNAFVGVLNHESVCACSIQNPSGP